MNTNLIIFGATGDLMHEKLIPAVNALLVHEHIGSESQIIAVGRRAYTQEEYKIEALKKLPDNYDSKIIWDHLTYVSIDFHDPL
jgi:glucose-6-phosphate 1-dehydrogenase